MTPPLKKIMYVDDEPDIQTLVKFSLEDVGGFEVELCGSGKQALQKINDFFPQIVLLDVMMPEMDGIATLKEMKKTIANCPLILFMTAKIQQSEIQQYKDLGAVDVISKPFDAMALPQIIESIWQKYHDAGSNL